MHFGYSEDELTGPDSTPEVNGVRSDCSEISAGREAATTWIFPGHDYSHLVGDPAARYSRQSTALLTHGLLTEDDLILLRFGMRIVW